MVAVGAGLFAVLASLACLPAQDRLSPRPQTNERLRLVVEDRDRAKAEHGRGPEVEPAVRQVLRLKAGTFDPQTESVLDPLLTGRSALWIVQFDGKPTEAWRDDVHAAGGSIVSYLPDYAYVVRAVEDDIIEAITAMPSVRFVGPYHPGYRLQPKLATALASGAELPEQRYDLIVCDRHLDKPVLARAIESWGGGVDEVFDGSILMEVTLDAAQLLQVANHDCVLWINEWSAPVEQMHHARIQCGANYVDLSDRDVR